MQIFKRSKSYENKEFDNVFENNSHSSKEVLELLSFEEHDVDKDMLNTLINLDNLNSSDIPRNMWGQRFELFLVNLFERALNGTSIEDQTRAIMVNLEIDDSSKLICDAVLTVFCAVVGGSATASALIDPEPATKTILIGIACDLGTLYFITTSSVGAFKFFEAKDFKQACNDGNLNLVYTKAGYESMFNDLWDPWETGNYIYKFSTDSMNGRVLTKITLNRGPQDVVDYCGFGQ